MKGIFTGKKKNYGFILGQDDRTYFIHKGTNGRWKSVLSADELVLYHDAMTGTLPPDCAAWLESGGAYDIPADVADPLKAGTAPC